MARSFTISGAGLNREGLVSISLGDSAVEKSSRDTAGSNSLDKSRRKVRVKRFAHEWNVQLLDFYSLEKSAEVVVINHDEKLGHYHVRDCSKCGSREKVPGCKRCGGNRFGVFHILGNIHGLFCQKCSLGVDRWSCPSCHHSNTCDQSIKLLTRDRQKPQRTPQEYTYSGGNPASAIWNYLIIFLLIIFLITQALS